MREKKHYKLFDNAHFDTGMLVEYYIVGKTPIETLNDLSTVT